MSSNVLYLSISLYISISPSIYSIFICYPSSYSILSITSLSILYLSLLYLFCYLFLFYLAVYLSIYVSPVSLSSISLSFHIDLCIHPSTQLCPYVYDLYPINVFSISIYVIYLSLSPFYLSIILSSFLYIYLHPHLSLSISSMYIS